MACNSDSCCFLLAAGLTLVFGIMDMINLAHGSLYMAGAYLAAAATQASGSFVVGIGAAMVGTALLGALLEVALLRRLYARNHLAQVLATFALILIFNEVVRLVWGAQPVLLNAPEALSGPVSIGGFFYPAYRLLIIVVGTLIAALLYVLVTQTRLGMWVRAGRVEPRNDRGAGDQRAPAVYLRLRFRRGALRARRRAAWPVAGGAGRHGRVDPDPGFRGDRHRRHRGRFAARSSAACWSASSIRWAAPRCLRCCVSCCRRRWRPTSVRRWRRS